MKLQLNKSAKTPIIRVSQENFVQRECTFKNQTNIHNLKEANLNLKKTSFRMLNFGENEPITADYPLKFPLRPVDKFLSSIKVERLDGEMPSEKLDFKLRKLRTRKVGEDLELRNALSCITHVSHHQNFHM